MTDPRGQTETRSVTVNVPTYKRERGLDRKSVV